MQRRILDSASSLNRTMRKSRLIYLIGMMLLTSIALLPPLTAHGQDEPAADSREDLAPPDFEKMDESFSILLRLLIAEIPSGDSAAAAEEEEEEASAADTPQEDSASQRVGLIRSAQGQVAIAIQHTGFLQSAITGDSLDDARKHTEHIVNILGGEEGAFFGDLDQNGQAQNPGDGVGVLTYLQSAENVAQQLADIVDGSDVALQASDLATAALSEITNSFDTTEQIQTKAIVLLSASDIEQVTQAADELYPLTAQLATSVGDAAALLNELAHMLSLPAEPPIDFSALGETVEEELDSIDADLASAQEQINIAIQHTGFLQGAITDENVDGARQHTEHIVNILDGEEGALFGDLDQNGQAQNPGDGVGVLVYQNNILAAAQVVNERFDAEAPETAVAESSDALVQTMGSSITAVLSTQVKAIELIAAADIDAINPIAQEMAGSLIEATEAISRTLLIRDELKQLLLSSLENGAGEDTAALDADAQRAALIQELAAFQSEIDEAVEPMAEALANARAQLDIAIQHTGFLQDALTDENLESAKTHGEHVTNILEGENSAAFGDLNGDGQTQNPGDGVGVRIYLETLQSLGEQLQSVLIEPASEEVAAASRDLNEGLVALTDTTGDSLLDDAATATTQLLQLIGSTSVDSADSLSIESRELLIDLDASLAEISELKASLDSSLAQAIAVTSESLGIDAADTEPPAPDANGYTLIITGSAQIDIAVTHVGFLNDAINGDDLETARAHAEHVVNIIEGETGTYYGDLDLNGQIQNPGDGVGARTYLDEALRQYTDLASDPALAEFESQLQSMRVAIDEVEQLLLPASEIVHKIFAVDSTAEAEPFITEATALVSAAAEQMDLALEIQLAPDDDSGSGVLIEAPTMEANHGDTWVSQNEGSTFVFIEGGPATMGADADIASSPREQPAHEVDVAGFWIQQTETTNAQYRACIDAGACTPPDNELWEEDAFAAHPALDLSWLQARQYAEWRGARLPSEAEWEKACRGGDERIYPWGDEIPDETLANFDNSASGTTEVGDYPDGATSEGLLDMSGNAWEWTSTLNDLYPYDATDGRENPTAAGKRVARGGSFFYTRYQASCIARAGFDVDSPNAGVRLVLLSTEGQWVNPIDNATYLLVDGGPFTMGASAEQAVSQKEQPAHDVELGPFWIQQTETTNGQYSGCVDAGLCSPPDNNFWDEPSNGEHPVTHVTFEQAQNYAAYVNGRLPTEAEWEKACRGADERLYPWGNQEPSGDFSNYNNLIGKPVAVGSYPAGSSPFGLFDMSGNVWEWTSSLEQPYPYVADDGREAAGSNSSEREKRIMRGGSFYYTRYQISCVARSGFAVSNLGENFGFRVVVDDPE